MSVFVRASLQGTPKTSPGHVALHHMPGLPMNLQHHFLRLGPQRPTLHLQHHVLHLYLQCNAWSCSPLPHTGFVPESAKSAEPAAAAKAQAAKTHAARAQVSDATPLDLRR